MKKNKKKLKITKKSENPYRKPIIDQRLDGWRNHSVNDCD